MRDKTRAGQDARPRVYVQKYILTGLARQVWRFPASNVISQLPRIPQKCIWPLTSRRHGGRAVVGVKGEELNSWFTNVLSCGLEAGSMTSLEVFWGAYGGRCETRLDRALHSCIAGARSCAVQADHHLLATLSWLCVARAA